MRINDNKSLQVSTRTQPEQLTSTDYYPHHHFYHHFYRKFLPPSQDAFF